MPDTGGYCMDPGKVNFVCAYGLYSNGENQQNKTKSEKHSHDVHA